MAFGDLNSLALQAASILCSKAALSPCPTSVVAPAAPEDLPQGGHNETPNSQQCCPMVGRAWLWKAHRRGLLLIALSLGSLFLGAGHPAVKGHVPHSSLVAGDFAGRAAEAPSGPPHLCTAVDRPVPP